MRLMVWEGVDVGFQGSPVLRGVSMEIHVGDVIRVAGANGSGKSTLIKTLLGILPTLRGKILWDIGPEEVGYVPQVPAAGFHLPMTVEECVGLGLAGLDLNGREARMRVECELDRMILGDLRTHQVATLSGGQTRRMLLARALVRRPRLLVADEPSTGLDKASKETWVRVVGEEMRSRSMAFLWVSHEEGGLQATHTILCGTGVTLIEAHLPRGPAAAHPHGAPSGPRRGGPPAASPLDQHGA